MVQNDRQDRRTTGASVRVSLARVGRAEHLKRDVGTEALVASEPNRVRRVRLVAHVEHVPRPHDLASDVAQPDLGVGDRRRGARRVGLRDRHVRRHRPIGDASVLDVYPHPHFSERDRHRLEARHLRPQSRATHNPVSTDERLHISGRVVSNVGSGLCVERG